MNRRGRLPLMDALCPCVHVLLSWPFCVVVVELVCTRGGSAGSSPGEELGLLQTTDFIISSNDSACGEIRQSWSLLCGRTSW